MLNLDRPYRVLTVAGLMTALLVTSGCSWFRKDNALYAQSPETRPLEVPPDLNQPDTSGAMKLPAQPGAASVTRSSMTAAPAAQANPSGFTIAGQKDQVFERVGTALEQIDGVKIASKAQLLSVYDIDYQSTKFLVRIAQAGDQNVYVSAVDARGVPVSSEAAVTLMSTLKTRLDGQN